MLRFFENFDFEGENFEKGKNVENFGNFLGIFKILNIRDSSFVAPTNSTSFHIRKLIVALKLHPWWRFP